ncbi:MAG: serine/threonine-protein kinase, partial [bacterium]
MVGKTVLHYRIQNELGRGGMGVVYMAEDQRLNRIVALKFLPPDLQINPKMRSRLFQEAQAASALNHPNICVIHDIGEENGKQYIVMEYVDGQTMREILSMEAPIPEKRVVEICGKICEALAAAHTKGIIHRDIKPENVMISADGFVKIMDFGLAKLVENADTDASRLGHTGEDHSETAALGAGVFKSSLSAFQGTAWYMSPEQILKDKVDARSDQFSLGVMMYELLTGEQPFRGRDSVAVMKAIVQDEPPPPASINPEV